MPNSQTDTLFLIVKSLNKAEKRFFKLYIARNAESRDAKFMRMFDLLVKMKTYDEKQLLKKDRSIRQSQLANLKSYLFNDLLVALRLMHRSKNLDIQIREQIDFAKVLYNRGLFLQSLKILDKVKTLAKQNSHFVLTLEILEFEKSIELRHITRSIKKRADYLAEETSYIVQHITEVSQLSSLSLLMYGRYLETGHVKNEKESRNIEKFFHQKLESIKYFQVSFFGQAYLYQAYCWYYFIQLDFARYYRHADKWVKLFDKHDTALKQEPFLYIKAMHNLLSALFMTGKYARMIDELRQMEKFYHQSIAINENLHMQTFVYLNTARINLHFLEGTFKDGLKLIPEIENKLVQFKNNIDVHRIMIFNYKIACLYFGAGDNAKCILYLNRVINLKVGHLRSDIQCFARILHLVAHYESGNTDILEYLVRSVFRFLAKMEDLDNVQQEILRFLKQSLSTKQSNQLQRFIELRNKFRKLSRNKYNRRSFQYLDILSWLESKIRNIPVASVIRERFLKTQ